MIRTVLLIGLGKIGFGYDAELNPKNFILSHARACSIHDNFELIGGVDINAIQCDKFKNLYGCEVYPDIRTALSSLKPNLIIIASPTETHFENIQQIFKYYSPDSILCEKPLSYNADEADEILRLCKINRTKLFVNYHRRSDVGVQTIKKMLVDLPKEEIVKGFCWYSKGIFNNGSHFLNLLQYWLGAVLEFSIIQKNRHWLGIDPEPDVFFQFEKGSIVFLSAKEENYSHYTIELVLSSGRLRYDQGGKKIFWQEKKNDLNLPGYTFLSNEITEIANGLNFSQFNVLNQVSLALDGQMANICDGKESLDTLSILNKIKAML